MSGTSTSFVRKWLAPAIVGGALLAAVAAVGVSAAASGAASSAAAVAAAAPDVAAAAAAVPEAAVNAAVPAPAVGVPENFGGGDLGFGGDGGGGITITAINGNQLSLATVDGWTRTIDASGATVTSGTATIALGDLKVGDEIRFAEARNFNGTLQITKIARVAPEVDGTITAIDATSLTVKLADGSTRSVALTATTTYNVNGATSTRDAVVVGNVAHIDGTSAGGTFTATAVSVRPASIGGTVTAKTADSITVSDASGATATINVTASTTYRTASGTVADVNVGSVVRAQGVKAADGSLTATSVTVGTADGGFGRGGHGGDGGPGGHRGGPGGFGGGPNGGTAPNAPAPSPSASPSA